MQEDRVIRTEENIRTDGQTRRMAVIKLRVIDLGYPSLRVRSPDGRGDGSFAISCIPSFISVIVRSFVVAAAFRRPSRLPRLSFSSFLLFFSFIVQPLYHLSKSVLCRMQMRLSTRGEISVVQKLPKR